MTIDKSKIMNKLSIKKLNTTAVDASAVPALMDAAGVEFNPIACVNWADYPYQPEVKFRAAHTGDAILLHYQVTEASVRPWLWLTMVRCGKMLV